jgi:hypothetical protein
VSYALIALSVIAAIVMGVLTESPRTHTSKHRRRRQGRVLSAGACLIPPSKRATWRATWRSDLASIEDSRERRRYVRSNLAKLPGLAWILWQRTVFATLRSGLDWVVSYESRTAMAILAIVAWPGYAVFADAGLTGLLEGLQGLGVIACTLYWGAVVYRRGRHIEARPWPPPKPKAEPGEGQPQR